MLGGLDALERVGRRQTFERGQRPRRGAQGLLLAAEPRRRPALRFTRALTFTGTRTRTGALAATGTEHGEHEPDDPARTVRSKREHPASSLGGRER